MQTSHPNPEAHTGPIVVSTQVKPLGIPIIEIKSLKEILTYQNPKVIERFEDEFGLNTEEASTLFADVLLFLYVVATTDKKKEITPTAAIDEGWHEFLMFTRDYQAFCKEFFGVFIHHTPYTRADKANKRGAPRKAGVEIAQKLWPVPLSKNWGTDIVVSGDCDGGSCSGDCCPLFGD